MVTRLALKNVIYLHNFSRGVSILDTQNLIDFVKS